MISHCHTFLVRSTSPQGSRLTNSIPVRGVPVGGSNTEASIMRYSTLRGRIWTTVDIKCLDCKNQWKWFYFFLPASRDARPRTCPEKSLHSEPNRNCWLLHAIQLIVWHKVRRILYLGPYLVVVSQKKRGFFACTLHNSEVSVIQETLITSQRHAVNKFDAELERHQTNAALFKHKTWKVWLVDFGRLLYFYLSCSTGTWSTATRPWSKHCSHFCLWHQTAEAPSTPTTHDWYLQRSKTLNTYMYMEDVELEVLLVSLLLWSIA